MIPGSRYTGLKSQFVKINALMNGTSDQVSMAEQETLKQQAMNEARPITDPAYISNNAQAQMLAYGQMPPSPYRS